MPNSSPAEDFSSTTENNLDLKSIPTHTRYVTLQDTWVEELGITSAYLYGLIMVLSGEKEHAWAFDSTLAAKMKIGERQLQRLLSELETKGWIYRNTYNTPRGRKRHIVPKHRYADYWKTFLSRDVVPLEVKQKFMKHFFGENNKGLYEEHIEPTKMSPKVKKDLHMTNLTGAYASDKNDTSLLLRNNIELHKRTTTEENVAVELQKSGISGELLEIGLQYYQANKDRIDKKNNPMGFLIYAVKKGIAADEMEKVKNDNDAVVAEEKTWTENETKAKNLYQELKKQQFGFSMHLDEHAIFFQFSDGGLPIGWRDPQFNKLIHVARRKAYEHIHHSRQTNSLDESKTKGK